MNGEHIMINENTKVIAIEGTDGSGKDTQVSLLNDYLKYKGYHIRVSDFPSYDQFFGKCIGDLLTTKMPDDPKSRALWYAADRFDDSNRVKSEEELYDIIVQNRSVVSGIIYAISICQTEEEKKFLADWIYKMEKEKFGSVVAKSCIILDVNREASLTNIGNKGYREYLGDNSDVFETDDKFMKETIINYRNAKKYIPEIEIELINCCDEDGNMRSIQDVHNDIVELVERMISNGIDK